MARVTIRSITSRRQFNYEYFSDEIKREFNQEIKPDIIALYDGIVQQWNQKPDFQGRVIIHRNSVQVDVYAVGAHKDIFNLVSAGARRHTITARNAPTLVFQRGYRAASVPGALYSGRAQKFGSYRRVYSVNHPGFAPRDFHQTVAKVYKPVMARRIENALRRAARRI